LGIDLGEKRIGLALSDALGILASPLEVFEYDSQETALEHILAVVKRSDVKKVVVGLPLNMNGSRGPEAQAAEAFADMLKQILEVPIVCWDERLTTSQAEKALLEADVSRAGRRTRKDMVAAALLLQAYLDTAAGKEASSS
jgi:putative Holliday junction resolvase